MLLIAGGFCCLFADCLSIQPRYPWELLADYIFEDEFCSDANSLGLH